MSSPSPCHCPTPRRPPLSQHELASRLEEWKQSKAALYAVEQRPIAYNAALFRVVMHLQFKHRSLRVDGMGTYEDNDDVSVMSLLSSYVPMSNTYHREYTLSDRLLHSFRLHTCLIRLVVVGQWSLGISS